MVVRNNSTYFSQIKNQHTVNIFNINNIREGGKLRKNGGGGLTPPSIYPLLI